VLVIRPDSWNLPLLVHVAGAALMVGALVCVTAALVLAWGRADRGEAAMLTRFGFRALLLGAIPAYVIMRVGAEWVVSEEGLADVDPLWIGIGYSTADLGLLVLIVATVLAGFAARRLRAGGGTGLARAAGVMCVLLVAAYTVALWAMTAKPV